MNKIIGIITFHKAHNFGAQLQAYALQKAINDLGFTSEFIDYRNIGESEAFPFKLTLNLRRLLIGIYRYILVFTWRKSRRKYFQEFINSHLRVSSESYNNQIELKKSNKVYDAFICGSDQVWNLNLTNHDFAYFLNFVDKQKNKISYAASFGEFISGTQSELLALIANIDHISIREKSSLDFINNCIGKGVFIALDPTLLIEKRVWMQLASQTKIKDPYILCYALGDQPGMMELCLHLKKTLNYSIIKIGVVPEKKNVDYNFIYNIGPQEFLGYLNNATIIVTNSFHGVALSIKFQKIFYAIPTGGKIDYEKNSRIIDLLKLVRLSDRLFLPENALPTKEKIQIDYGNSTNVLEVEIRKSISFLHDSLCL